MKKINYLSWAHPLLQRWFKSKLGNPTEPQKKGWPAILAGKNVLISAPTGSGKTLAAFLICINKLLKKACAQKLKDEIEVIYISPLKALGNDIQKNLLEPITEIAALADEPSSINDIRVLVRTGDTLAKERRNFLKKPPHILITTPESLYILLTADKTRELLKTVKTVIVDEIHALCNNKRGSHLTLSLARLDEIALKKPVRIGLSATQKPIEKVADYLVGKGTKPHIVNIGHERNVDLTIELPKTPLSSVMSNEMWDEVYDRLSELVNENRSTLVFVNNRRLSERIAHHLKERIGEEFVGTHHGSLSRKIRLQAETKLKNGELKVLVATASLELGIDIGSIDLVCQIGSPRSIAAALQRIGRAGHHFQKISKGAFFATNRDELIECVALIAAIKEGLLDELIIPEKPLDILAQQIVAMCATQDWELKKLYQLIIKAYPYQDLTYEEFKQVILMLTSGMNGSRGRYGAYLFYDEVNGLVKGRRGAKITAITNGGAIADNGLFTVVSEKEGIVVGTLDEDFAVESNRGDIILLGATSWQIKRVENKGGRVIVEDAHGAPPSVPFWRGEGPGRSNELSAEVAKIRELFNQLLPSDATTNDIKNPQNLPIINWLTEKTNLSQSGSEQIINYILEGRALLGAVPTQQVIIAERFFDEAGGMQLIIHSPFGARINKAFGLALRKCFCRSFDFELQAAATDDGLSISLTEKHSFPLSDVFKFVHPNTLEKTLTQAVIQSPLFLTRFRWDATRSLALQRLRFGKKTPPNIQRMLSEDLLASIFPEAVACQDNIVGEIELPDHPIINETMKDCLHEALDIDGLSALLTNIQSGKIKCIAIDTPLPSVFAQQIINANQYAFLDDAPLEERRTRAVSMRRHLPPEMLKEAGKLDQEVIRSVKDAVWPDVRSSDELHDLLQTLIALPLNELLNDVPINIQEWQAFFETLKIDKRAGLAVVGNKSYWFATEKKLSFIRIYPDAIQDDVPEIEKKTDIDLTHLLRGWFMYLGPITAKELAQFFNLSISEIEVALLKLEASGLILRGQFRTTINDIEWCERRILARIHRLTIDKLRKEIEPVTAEKFLNWLLLWQHVAPNQQLKGENGLLEVINQLQGFEAPAASFELILKKRVSDFTEDMLDKLVLSGQVGWGRLRLHPVFSNNKKSKKIFPNKNIPISFFIREENHWFPTKAHLMEEQLSNLSHVSQAIYKFILQKGASFFSNLKNNLSYLKSEIENGLWELVAAGLITSDSYDNLRALINRRRRLHYRGEKPMKQNYGRWSLLIEENIVDQTEKMNAICWILLKRYGVVFREIIEREKNIPSWYEILLSLRRLEEQGEIRGGHFIKGFRGEQFALPIALTSLRAHTLISEKVILSSSDPLNLIGILLPGKKIINTSQKLLSLDLSA